MNPKNYFIAYANNQFIDITKDMISNIVYKKIKTLLFTRDINDNKLKNIIDKIDYYIRIFYFDFK